MRVQDGSQPLLPADALALLTPSSTGVMPCSSSTMELGLTRQESWASRAATPRGSKLPIAMDGMIAAASAHLQDASENPPEATSRRYHERPTSSTGRERTSPNQESAPSPSLQRLGSASGSRSQSRLGSATPVDGPDQRSVSLDNYSDSFPLVPLPIIPQLGLDDLQRLARGLQDLLDSLHASTSVEDQQLAKYAARQLSLVHRQYEQLRAEARFRALIAGELSAVAAPLPTAKAPAPADSAAARPIFLTPATTSAKPAPSPDRRLSHRSASSFPSSSSTASPSAPPGLAASSSAHYLRSKKEALERAKALVRANNASRPGIPTATAAAGATISPFVITSGDTGSKKRRRPAKRLTPEEAAEQKARQLEKEREARRQAAYQRLLARQELQAKKKEQARARTRHATPGESTDPHTGDTISSTVTSEPAAAAAAGSRAVADGDSGSESDASEVSNLSEGDSEDEKQIMAMKVATPRSTSPEDDGDDDHCNGSDYDRGTEDQEGSELETSNTLKEVALDNTVNVATDDLISESKSPLLAPDVALTSPPRTEIPIFLRPSENSFLEDREGYRSSCATSKLKSSIVDDEEMQREAINFGLQQFVSARAAAKLQELQENSKRGAGSARRVLGHSSISSITSSKPSTDKAPRCPALFALDGEDNVECGQVSASEHMTRDRDDVEMAPDDQASADADEQLPERAALSTLDAIELGAQSQQPSDDDDGKPIGEPSASQQYQISARTNEPASSSSAVTIPVLAIPSNVTTKCKDYRSYFSSFHCILTSAYEQRVAIDPPSNSRESLTAATVIHPPNDNSLRLQLKLYQGWQSIMQDYTTVFGTNIATPSSMLPSASPFTAHYRINSTTRREVCEIVTTALDKLGDWEEHASGLGLKTTWNLLWTWSKPRVERKTLLVWQKVNHFQHAKALTRKDCLKKNIGKYLAMGGRMKQAYESFVPKTFLLPQEYVAFVQAFQARGASLAGSKSNIWIMKPVALSRGRGISLVSDLSDVVYGEQVVIQEYVSNPLLLDGYKFDLRLYVLVTSFNPLEGFFYEDGFVRICTRPYHDGDLSDLFVHLTNSSIQKENQDAISTSDNPINEADGREAGGTKMTLSYLWKRLEAMGADVDKVKRDIDEVVLKSLICGEDHIPFQINSFDLLGYDILLDDAFRPWLIEINASPSMARENALDYQVRCSLAAVDVVVVARRLACSP